MDLTSEGSRTRTYDRVGPFFYDNEVIGVVEGKYVVDRVRRTSIKSVRFERRSSFKHPGVGMILGFVLLLLPVQALMGDPLGIGWLTLASAEGVVGAFFMFLFGLCLLWAVLRRRHEDWVVFVLERTEHPVPLRCVVSPEVTQFIEGLVAGQTSGWPSITVTHRVSGLPRLLPARS